MSVSTHLDATVSQLLPQAAESDSIKRSISTLSYRLSSYFETTLNGQIQFGSSKRGTMLPRVYDPQSDVDYMVVFDNSGGHQPQTLLDRLRRFARHWYSSSEIKQSRPTLILQLAHIMFDLVPAYRSWGRLYIPAPNSSFLDWTSTDPNGFNQELVDANAANSYRIKPLIRLLKYWNASNRYVFDSYWLEGWVVRRFFFLDSTLKDYFFSTVRGLPEPWGFAQWRIDAIQRAKGIVTEANELEAAGLYATAENKIKRLIP